jgi:hypothetical protein
MSSEVSSHYAYGEGSVAAPEQRALSSRRRMDGTDAVTGSSGEQGPIAVVELENQTLRRRTSACDGCWTAPLTTPSSP